MRLVLLLLLISAQVLAQDPSVITFQEAVDLAKANNLELKKSEQNVRLKNSDFLLTQSQLFPKLSLNISKAFGYKERIFETDLFGINLLLPLFDGKKLFETGFKHDLYLSAKTKNRFEVESLIHKVGILYIDALQLEAAKNIAKEAWEQNQQQLLVLEKKLEVGRARKLDILRSQYLVSKAESDFLQKEQSFSQKMAELSQQIVVDKAFKLSMVNIESPYLKMSQEELLSLAQNNQETQALKRDLIAANKNLLAEKLDFLPKLSLGADLGMERHLPSFDHESNVRLLLNLELPLFSGGSSLAMIKSKLASQTIAEINLRQKEQESHFSVILMVEEMRRLELIKANTEQGLKAAVEARSSAERMFKEGEATSLEMVEANTNLFNAKTQSSSTALELERLKLKLLFKVGKL